MSLYKPEFSRQQNSSYALEKENKKKVVDLKEIYKTVYIEICSCQINYPNLLGKSSYILSSQIFP